MAKKTHIKVRLVPEAKPGCVFCKPGYLHHSWIDSDDEENQN